MMLPWLSMHPSDETLSRLADRSEIERMRWRAGRHLARCARCRGEVAAIEALGEAARGLRGPALPPALGRRVAERRRLAGPVAPSSLEAAAEGSLAGGRRRPSTAQRWGGVAVAAAIVLFALAGPIWHRRTLAAASEGEASIYPRYPRPGTTVGVRFLPGARWQGGDTLWAWGIVDLRTPDRTNGRLASVTVGAALVRGRDGAYRGRVVLPDDALSGVINIAGFSGATLLPRSVARLVVLTAAPQGDRPSLDALESAVYNDRYIMRAPIVADAFARWAPSHPMRWLVENVSGRPRRPFDWTRFFDSEQRRFATLTEQLRDRTDLRPAEMAGMAGLAYRIEEPEIAAEWTERLLREHPGDPWALELRARQIHEMELRSAPHDSIAALIPSLDSLYPTSRASRGVLYDLTRITSRQADPATRRRWQLRAARAGIIGAPGYLGQPPAFSDPELRDSIAAYARELVRRHPAPASWNGPMNLLDPGLQRVIGYSLLASAALARHEYPAALALSDSARLGSCVWPARGTNALARLALGDTAAAIPALAGYGRAPGAVVPDSARQLLGSYFNPQQWQAAVDSAERGRRSCRRQGT